jgi:hypothetical protein
MVMHLDRPGVDEFALIDDVVEERQTGRNAQFFSSLLVPWKTRVQEYIEKKGNPEIMTPWTSVLAHKAKFHNLYLHPRDKDAQKPILDDLRSRQLQLCPACGEDGTPNTLDHYLPKEFFPEFSVTPINLSPMCDICQGAKGIKTVNMANERLFLHPYFDDFTDVQIVSLEIGAPFDSPSFITVKPHTQLNIKQKELITRHLEELGIIRRYHHFFKDEYLRLLKLVNSIRRNGQDVHQYLNLFKFNALNKSVNSWLHIFYSGVLENVQLIQYLETGTLPSNLG